MSLDPEFLHRWRLSNLSAWTELDVTANELVVRKKTVEQRLRLADLSGITVKSQEMTPGREVLLTFRDGPTITMSDWAPQGFGGRQQEKGRLTLALGLIVDAVPEAQRPQVTWRVVHSRAAWTLTAGLVTFLVGGIMWLALAWSGPAPASMENTIQVITQVSQAVTLVGAALLVASALGWPTRVQTWTPWVEGLPERWRLSHLELLDASMAFLLWSLHRAHFKGRWPTLLPQIPKPGAPQAVEPGISGILTPALMGQDAVTIGDTTWRWNQDGLERDIAGVITLWPKSRLKGLHWRRHIGRRTLVLDLGDDEVVITDAPGQLTAWATSLRVAHLDVPATVDEDPRRRTWSFIVLTLVIAACLMLAYIALDELMEHHKRRHYGAFKVLGLALIGISWAAFAPPRWLRTGFGRRKWKNNDPEAS